MALRHAGLLRAKDDAVNQYGRGRINADCFAGLLEIEGHVVRAGAHIAISGESDKRIGPHTDEAQRRDG